MISTNLRIIAGVGSLALLLLIIELVRRRQLKEEYTVLWVTTAIVLFLLAVWGGLLRSLTHAIGAISQASTLYFFGLIFVIFLLLHFSLRVSQLERRVVSMIQEIALLGDAHRNRTPSAVHHEDGAEHEDGHTAQQRPGNTPPA